MVGVFWAAHPFPSFLVAGVTLAIALVAGKGAEYSTVAVLSVGMLLYQFSIGFANDAVDADLDARTGRDKPIPSGRVSRRAVSRLATVCALAGMATTWPLEHGAWYVGVAGLACGLSYDLALKRTGWSWVPLSVALPLIPAWAFLAFDAWEPLLWAGFPLGAVLGLAIHLANQSPDIAREATEDGGLAHRLGEARARSASVALFGAAGSGLALTLVFANEPAAAALAAAVTVAAGLVALRGSRVFGQSGLFGVLAAGSGCLGVLFVASV